MSNQIRSWLPGIIIGIALAVAGIVLNWPFVATIGAGIGIIVVVWLIYVLTVMVRFGWLRRFNRQVARLKAGEAPAVITELEARRAKGERSFEGTLALAAAYNYVGRTDDARLLVEEAQSQLDQAGTSAKHDMSSRAKCDLALVAQYDSQIVQGHFVEAAHSLRPHVSQSVQPNFMTAIIAWAFFLAGDTYNANVVLDHIQPETTRRNNKRVIGPKYQLMIAYMRHTLLGEDTRADLLDRGDQFADWEAEASRNAANPYGVRLRQILDDIRPLLA
jgi:hypothetical protein